MFAQATILGCLCADPESYFLPSGTQKVNLRLASNRKFKTQDGTQKEDTLFITAQVWGRTAEVAMQYLKKGQYVLVSGDLRTDSYTNQQGQAVSKIILNATEMKLMPKSVNQPQPQEQTQPAPNPQMQDQQQIQIADDEIPF